MKFSEKLKRLMLAKGLTQEELGKELRVSHVSVGGWLRGSLPRPRILAQLSSYFGISPEILLDDTKDLPVVIVERGVAKRLGLSFDASKGMSSGSSDMQELAFLEGVKGNLLMQAEALEKMTQAVSARINGIKRQQRSKR